MILTRQPVLAVRIVRRVAFMLVLPLIAVLPLERKVVVRTTRDLLPLAADSRTLAKSVFGPSGELDVPYAIDDVRLAREDGRVCVDLLEVAEDAMFQRNPSGEPDGTDGRLARGEPARAPRDFEDGHLPSGTDAVDHDVGRFAGDSTFAGAGLDGDVPLGDDPERDLAEGEDIEACVRAQSEGAGVQVHGNGVKDVVAMRDQLAEILWNVGLDDVEARQRVGIGAECSNVRKVVDVGGS